MFAVPRGGLTGFLRSLGSMRALTSTIARSAPRIRGFVQSQRVELSILIVYAVAIAVFARFHEPWRDEVRALSIVAEAGSVTEILPRLRNDGHPLLWYLLLHVAYWPTHKTVVLKIVAWLVAVAWAAVFLCCAPFKRWQKALFLAGIFPLYEYSVVARNYGLGALLLFCVCALYPSRLQRPARLGFLIFLLAQVHAYWLMVAFALSFALVLEFAVIWLRTRGAKSELNGKGVLVSILWMLAGGIASVLELRTDSTSALFTPSQLGFGALSAWIKPVLAPMGSFGAAFAAPELGTVFGSNALAAGCLSILLWLLALSLLATPFAFLPFALTWLLLGAFGALVFPAALRHQGVLYVMLVAAVWLARLSDTGLREPVRRWLSIAQATALMLLCLPQVAGAYELVARDLREELTSAKAFGAFIRAHDEYRRAVLICDPDYVCESLPYYRSNSIYLPREGRYRKFASFSSESSAALSVAQLLDAARQVHRDTGQPVLIVLRQRLSARGSKRGLVHTPEMYTEFKRTTELVASFRQSRALGEYYDVYALRDR